MIRTDDALARRIFVGALAVGVAADLLLRASPLGLNVTLCTVLSLGVGAELVRERGLPVSREARWLALTALLLAFAFVRRDSRTLAGYDFLALIATLGLTGAALRGVRLARLNIVDQVRQVFYAAGNSLIGAFPLLARVVRSARQGASPAYGRTRAVVLGVAIATPVLLGFGALFAGADPVFGNAMRGAFDFDAGLATSHVVLVLFFSGLSAGYLFWAVLRPNPIPPRAPQITGVPVGAVPILTSLVLTVGLFGLFVAFQAGELFGGTARVERAAGPSYAEYARSGFFELLAVAALVLPLLILADRALGSHLGNSGRWFRVLARTLLALLFVIIVSALNRMRLYVAAYGLSEIRLYATAAMAYVTFLASWLGATLIRHRRRRFAPGALVAGYVALTGLHVINPDALIVRVNMSRATGRPFDAAYATSLSADAIPSLLDGLSRLDPNTRCSVRQSLRRRWLRLDESQDHDWRALNWARLSEIRLARHWTSIPYVRTCALPEAK